MENKLSQGSGLRDRKILGMVRVTAGAVATKNTSFGWLKASTMAGSAAGVLDRQPR